MQYALNHIQNRPRHPWFWMAGFITNVSTMAWEKLTRLSAFTLENDDSLEY